jgi:hypothetical protein
MANLRRKSCVLKEAAVLLAIIIASGLFSYVNKVLQACKYSVYGFCSFVDFSAAAPTKKKKKKKKIKKKKKHIEDKQPTKGKEKKNHTLLWESHNA